MKPLTRKEFFMAKAAGQTVPDLEPITREEYFLNQIAESGGGGGNAVYINFDTGDGSIDASFNELLQYYNEGKFLFSSIMFEDEGATTYRWFMVTQLQRVSNDQSFTYIATLTAFGFAEGEPYMDPMFFIASDPDEKMVVED